MGGGTVNEKEVAGSAAQPLGRPMTRLFGNGSKAHPGGYGFAGALSGTARCGPALRQNTSRAEATTVPAGIPAERRRETPSPLKPAHKPPGAGPVRVPPPGRGEDTWGRDR